MTPSKKKHLEEPFLKEFMLNHCTSDPYKLEICKGCWHSQLCSLRAQNFGELPKDKVQELYFRFKCKFGFPPPGTPAAVFVGNMHEVPRPMKTATNKYASFEDCYGKPTPVDIPPLKPGAPTEIAPPGVLDKDKVQVTIS